MPDGNVHGAKVSRRDGVPVEAGLHLFAGVRKGQTAGEVRGVGKRNDARRGDGFDTGYRFQFAESLFDVLSLAAGILIGNGR